MTHPPRGAESLTTLRAQIGTSDSRLHVDYRPSKGEWTRVEWTSGSDPAATHDTHVQVNDPVSDLVRLVLSWGGPVAVDVDGMDPEDLLATLRPAAFGQPTVQINGQTFGV